MLSDFLPAKSKRLAAFAVLLPAVVAVMISCFHSTEEDTIPLLSLGSYNFSGKNMKYQFRNDETLYLTVDKTFDGLANGEYKFTYTYNKPEITIYWYTGGGSVPPHWPETYKTELFIKSSGKLAFKGYDRETYTRD
jgi:hypothetical protein